MKRTGQIVMLLAVCCAGAALVSAPKTAGEGSRRQQAQKLYRDGNYKEAYEVFSKLALDSATDARQVGGDLNS